MCVRMDEHIHIHVRFSMLFPSIFTSITLCLFLLTCTLPQSHSQPPPPPPPPLPDYSICKDSSYNCGTLTDISYPFWGQNRPLICGGGEMFHLTCQPDLTTTTTTVLIASQNFTVLHIDPNSYTMTMKPTDFNVCSPQFNDTFLIGEVFQYATSVSYITIFYDCSGSEEYLYSCGGQKRAFSHVGVGDAKLKEISESQGCTGHVNVPALGPYYDHDGIIERDDLELVLNKGFEVKYNVSPECISYQVDFGKQGGSSCYYCSNGTNHCTDSHKSMSSILSPLPK